MYPSFAPWTTPAYSDIAFQLLSYALENIAGRPFNVSLAEKVLKPLGLSHTFLQGANESMGIVPRLSDSRSWKVHIGDLNPYDLSPDDLFLVDHVFEIKRLNLLIMLDLIARETSSRRLVTCQHSGWQF